MASTTQLSLEPLQPFAGDGHDSDLFARPARLREVRLDDGREVFTRDDPKKSLQERLARVWAERGDYSELSEERILNPAKEHELADKEDKDPRPTVDDIRALQETMINNLALARGELTTALDLLSVLSAPRDPPDVDVASLPLPQQTLSFVPTAPPPRPSTDPQQNPLAPIPLASSLDALSRSARAFFSASEELVPLSDEELAALASSNSAAASRPRPRQRARAPDPWPTILRLHHGGARTLAPLGAGKGASLAAGKGESRTARSVGVFFGAQEAGAAWRRASVAEVGELLDEGAEKRKGRRMVVEVGVEGAGKMERAVWDEEDDKAQDAMDEEEKGDDVDRVERVLKARGRAVFAEELFSQLTSEARSESALRAELQLGSRTEGDTIALSGSGWTVRVTMATTPDSSTPSHATAATLSSLLRLLFLQEYTARRTSTPNSAPRPLLATVAAYLGHAQRVDALRGVLERLRAKACEGEGEVEAAVAFDGEDEGQGAGRQAADVLHVLNGASVLGGRATLRLGKSTVFTVLYSSPLPPSPHAAAQAPPPSLPPSLQPTLTLRVPGRPAPLQLPSLRHLETFLGEQVDRACRVESARREKEREGAGEDKDKEGL
ncbi:uncharacterized protein RHOBADRAFT_51922 [Rhodotorula graminis WP1]|uniref:Mediator of RNA polymerase II transcription subunit 17 n=1 Tax=Rhodotorula graminis (strain WP1) TaxID=578459 RepID=A0A194S886_RHOGW|nr:uncharacterized protein RHOBADRAFT_51922 [Rhodotorula graminis WP1]KPV76943.1 hypothetical protein RHOBADRAFT_51922 [Rhodotorula graminis WP1]